MKVLNLYAGIGGNRKLWKDADVTAVEIDPEVAQVYRDHFPSDDVVEADAHEYLLEHFPDFDFIWSSPPCPTHSRIRHITSGEKQQNDPVYPDMRLYQEIILLKHHFDGDWVVENTVSYYDPLIKPFKRGRHYLWSNYYIPEIELPSSKNQHGTPEEWEAALGYDLSGYEFGTDESYRAYETRNGDRDKRQKILRNCVHPELGLHAFEAANQDRQATLPVVDDTEVRSDD